MQRVFNVIAISFTLAWAQLPATAETTVLDAARLIDVDNQRVVESPRVIVVDGRIVSVGETDALDIPTGATHLVLEGATLLPGLMDAHVHLTSRHDLHGYRSVTVTTPGSAITGTVNAKRTLLAGFTTVRNLGASGWADIAVRDAIDSGEIIGPRILAAGPALGITGGHCDTNLLPPEYEERSDGVADGPWAVRTAVRRNIKYGADVIKFCGTGGVLSKGTSIGAQQYTYEEMAALVDEAHLLGRRVAVHAHGTQGIKTAIRAGVDSVEHASLIDDEGIRLAKKNGTYLSMDIYVSDYILSEGEAAGILPESLDKERQVGSAQRESFNRAVKAGANIAFGTDAGVYPHGQNARQLAYLVRYGMTPMQAIYTATLGNATLFGIERDTGSVREGKAADIIAVQGDALENIRLLESVDFVMKDGEVYLDRLSSSTH